MNTFVRLIRRFIYCSVNFVASVTPSFLSRIFQLEIDGYVQTNGLHCTTRLSLTERNGHPILVSCCTKGPQSFTQSLSVFGPWIHILEQLLRLFDRSIEAVLFRLAIRIALGARREVVQTGGVNTAEGIVANVGVAIPALRIIRSSAI